jgi:hypothetical protein
MEDWPGFSLQKMLIFNSYVKLPEGKLHRYAYTYMIIHVYTLMS